MSSKWLCIALSALLYSCAFLFPTVCFWLALFYLIPLFLWSVRGETVSFLEGWWWGLGAYGTTLCTFWQVLYVHTQFPLNFFLPLLLLAYFSCMSGLFFYSASKLQKCASTMHILCAAFSWSVLFYVWWHWLTYYSLFFMGQWCGSFLLSPLLPLAHSHLLLLTRYFSTHGAYICLLIGSWSFVFFVRTKKIWYGLLCLGAYSFFLSGPFIFWLTDTGYISPWTNTLACITPSTDASAYKQAEAITHLLVECKQRYPQTRIIIAPESTVSYALNMSAHSIAMWHENALNDTITFICCAPRAHENDLYNSMYILTNGRIINYYDKKFLLPFFEKQHTLTNNHVKNSFNTGHNKRIAINIAGNSFIPFICAEFFIEQKEEERDIKNSKVPILCVANDRWFFGYMQKLLCGIARLKALLWKRDIFYVSHTYAFYCTSEGKEAALNSNIQNMACDIH